MDNIDAMDTIDVLDTYDDGINENESDSDGHDSDFQEFVIHIAFPRAGKRIHERSDPFSMFRDNEFLQRFRLSKRTVKFLIELTQHKLSSRTSRYCLLENIFV